MKVAVARRYEFNAVHRVEELGPPWNETHEHHYTVEVVAEVDRPEHLRLVQSAVVVDTDRFDAVWDELARSIGLDSDTRLVEGIPDLNEVTPTTTTVEALAVWMMDYFKDLGATQITVWEDDSRWGRCTR